jgi:hypothetical protein
MKPIKLLAIALVAVLVTAGLAAAAGGYGAGVQAGDTDRTRTNDGQGPGHDADARVQDGTNSPWLTDDDRLVQFQARFGLTDAQMNTLRTQVRAMLADGADHDAVREQVRTTLQSFGVEDPQLGPMDGFGPRGSGAGTGPMAGTGPHGPGSGMTHQGGAGTGPHGPADGSCMA